MGLTQLVGIKGIRVKRGLRGEAAFSADGLYRYALLRRWAPDGRIACYIMMNSSTADHDNDDMTIRKDMGFSVKLGCNALLAVNLGAYITKDPRKLLKAADPIGPLNGFVLRAAAMVSDLMIVAWGALPERLWERFQPSVEIVKSMKGLKCLGRTKSGAPHHPSRIAYKTPLENWP